MIESDKQRLIKITQTWQKAKSEISSKNITKEQLLNDTYTQWALTTPLYNIGEQVYKLSPELKEKYPEIKWNVVSGLRHRLVHNYDGINWTIIAEVVFCEMDIFIDKIEKIETE